VGDEKTRAISLGTSDTYFGYTHRVIDEPRQYGHIFGGADGGYMFLLCFKNGSLARQSVKDDYGLSWNDFSHILMDTAPGNHGRVMLPYFQPEITPLVLDAGVQRYGGLDPGDTEGNIRAVAEAQVMSMYLHSGWAGELPQKILVTAGGSTNKGLLRLIAQVFGAKVRVHDVADSAALGAALRAATVDQADISLEELARNWLGVLDREVVQAAPEETEVFKDLSDCCMFMPRARHITYLTGLRRKKPLQLFSRALDRKGYRRHPEYGPVFGMNN
jgi:xylulokinase